MSIHPAELLQDFSLEMTGKDVPGLAEAQPLLPPRTRVNVTFLGNENVELRVSAAAAVKDAGLIPVPHISARRLASEDALTEFLAALEQDGTSAHVFAVAGDPHEPEGPYEDALALVRSVPLGGHGVQTVSISGYPEGHPDIGAATLWDALEGKAAALADQGRAGDIITQFGFDVDPVIEWIGQVRARGIDLPIRVGVPGPAGVRRLLGYARRFGVASSAGIAKKYGFSLTNLLGTAGPDRFLTALASRLEPARHGVVRVHLYTFGGLRATAEWAHDYAASARESSGTDA